jgi:hypothetical protein
MAITSAIANEYKKGILNGLHLSSHTYKMALYVVAATIDGSNNAYVATNEVANGNGYATGGANMAGFSVALSANTAVLTFNNQVWANANFAAGGCMIYNSNLANNNMVACFTFGNNIVASGGNFTVQMPTADANNGLVRIA